MSRLLVISGLPGVGKTTVAAAVAGRTGAIHLSVDDAEERLLAAGATRGWNTGVAAYESVRVGAEEHLRRGADVVVDAVNDSDAARETWRAAARSTGSDLAFVVLVCSDRPEHRARLGGRERGLRHVPEPSWEDVTARDIEPWTDEHREIDTAGRTLEAVAVGVVDLFGESGPHLTELPPRSGRRSARSDARRP